MEVAIASLGLKINDSNNENSVITLDTGTLRYIDSIIKSFPNSETLKKDEEFSTKISHLSPNEIERSKIILTYIKNNDEKVLLKPIYNDPEPIHTRASSMDEVKSEVERTRKLLFSSKNQLFLSMFFNNQSLVRTTYSTIKMTVSEYKKAKDAGLSVIMRDAEYYITIKDALKYRLGHKKLGVMRILVEDALELWKKKMLDLSDEDLYYYSRELRLLINEYDYRKIPRRAVYNLNINKIKIDNMGNYIINKEDKISNVNTKGLYKRKILEDRKTA